MTGLMTDWMLRCALGTALVATAAGCGKDDSEPDGGGSDDGATTDGDGGDGGDDDGGSGGGGGGTGDDGGTRDTGGGSGGSGDTGGGSDDGCDCMAGGYAPVCGVDGTTYDAICGEHCVPVDIACEGECPCPAFMCGEMECAPGETVCNVLHGGPAGSEPSYTCGELPEACRDLPDPDCSCFETGPAGCECTEDPNDRFLIECYAP